MVASYSNLVFKGWYVAILSALNILMMIAFYLQFPLAARIKSIPLFSNIDWGIAKHKRMGQILGIFFLLHPFLIILPRFFMSSNDGFEAIRLIFTSENTLTGVIAWTLLIVWTLASIFKDKLPISYEAWKLTHLVGFIAITILATLHVTTIGRHGQMQPLLNLIWWGLCALCCSCMLYNYLIKPHKVKRNQFTLQNLEKISSRDWLVELKAKNKTSFNFKSGQFIWLNTDKNASPLHAHPFSIASSPKMQPNISFIIRSLGDYTSKLDTLSINQDVYLDGPYGELTLDKAKDAKRVVLIAGGAGIGPMLSLLRGLADANDPRSITLIYANKTQDQMVLQHEIQALKTSMSNFKQQLVLEEESEKAYHGFVDQKLLIRYAQSESTFYVCGPQGMINAVEKALLDLDINKKDIHFEQLSF